MMTTKEEFKKSIITRKHSVSSFDDFQVKTISEYLLAIKATVNDLREEIVNEKRSTESFVIDSINTQVQILYKKYQEFVEETEEKYQQKLKNIRLSCRQQMQDALIMLKADFERERDKHRIKDIDKKEKLFLLKRVKHLEQCMGEYETMLDGCSMPIVIESKKDPYHFSSEDMDFNLEQLTEEAPIESINLRIKVNRVQQDLIREKMKSKQVAQEMMIRNKLLNNYIKENEKLKSEKMGRSVDQNREAALKIKTIKEEYVAEVDRLKTRISELKQSLNEQRLLAQAYERKGATISKEQGRVIERRISGLSSKEDLDSERRSALSSMDDTLDADMRKSALSSRDGSLDGDKKKSAKSSKDDYKDADKKQSAVSSRETHLNVDKKKSAISSKEDYKDAKRKKSVISSKEDYKDAEKKKSAISSKEDYKDAKRKNSAKEDYKDAEKRGSALSPRESRLSPDRGTSSLSPEDDKDADKVII
ncbi:uncharacterized protein DDB_G0283697 [Octopus bimaculoides]|nr:uncharacterized protein DDB_G0283697 [Octopus bimaculoides]